MMLLFPFGLTADQMTFWGFIAVIVTVVLTLWSSIAATLAAKYAKDAPTKEDFRRLEDHAATTASHIEKVSAHTFNMDVRQQEQIDDEVMRDAIRHVSIHVEGETVRGTNLMTVRLTTKNEAICLLRVELKNELSSFGHAECVRQGAEQFSADFRVDDIQKWYDSATKTDLRARRVLTIHVHLQVGQQFVERDVQVYVQKGQIPLYKLEGNC